MTSVTFRSEGGRLCAFHVEGHSGYAPAGSDIVCAAVTSAVRLTECALNDVLGLAAPVRVRPREGAISLRLPTGLGETAEATSQTLLAALMVHLQALHEEYPDHIIVFCEDDEEEESSSHSQGKDG